MQFLHEGCTFLRSAEHSTVLPVNKMKELFIILAYTCIRKPPYLTFILRRSRTGTVWFYTSTSNKRAARPKLYTKSLTRDLQRMYSRLTLMRISINL